MKITAQLATIPERGGSLKQTLNSLINQVDELVIMLNNYTILPAWLYNFYTDKTCLVMRDNEKGDAEKFNGVNKYNGYIFTCDDDIIYPPDYVKTMIGKIEEYGRKALITCHGRTFRKDRPIKSYYRDKLVGYRCLGSVEHDVYVDSGGTGVMAWHSDLWRPEMDWFKAANMADVFIAIEARRRNIPIICIAHKEGWIQSTPEGHNGIWNKHVNNDRLQTDYFNGIL